MSEWRYCTKSRQVYLSVAEDVCRTLACDGGDHVGHNLSDVINQVKDRLDTLEKAEADRMLDKSPGDDDPPTFSSLRGIAPDKEIVETVFDLIYEAEVAAKPDVDQRLREQGLDPESLAAEGVGFVKNLKRKLHLKAIVEAKKQGWNEALDAVGNYFERFDTVAESQLKHYLKEIRDKGPE